MFFFFFVCARVYDFLICKMRSFSKNSWYEIAKIYFVIAQKQNLFTFPTKERALCTGDDLLFFNCNLTWALCIMLWIWGFQLFCFYFVQVERLWWTSELGLFIIYLIPCRHVFFDLIGFFVVLIIYFINFISPQLLPWSWLIYLGWINGSWMSQW